MARKGIDVSGWQSRVSFPGYDFVIIKASEGVGYTDPMFQAHVNGIVAGQQFGFYHFARPDLGNTPEAEADWFVSLVGKYKGKAVYALDWEAKSLDYPADWALRWLNRVYEKTGTRPMFYCSTAYVNTGKYAPLARANYGLWLAQYASEPTLSAGSGWSNMAIWQYTDDNGEGLDGDYFYGDERAWNAYAGMYKDEPAKPVEPEKPKPEPEPVKKSDETIALEVIAGKWGVGQDRINRLKAAGYNPTVIQDIVNKKLEKPAKKTNSAIAQEVIAGKWGNDPQRAQKLKAAGYNPTVIQDIVNKQLGAGRKSDEEIAREVIRGEWGNDPQRSQKLKAAGYNPATIQALVNKLL